VKPKAPVPLESEINRALYGQDRRKSKYGVDLSDKGKEDRTCDNIVFDSVHEMKVYRDYVKPNVNAGIFRNLAMQMHFTLIVRTPLGKDVTIGTYIADFVYEDHRGEMVILEAKGFRTPLYKRSRKHFETQSGKRIIEL
jgi:hypothetical protein